MIRAEVPSWPVSIFIAGDASRAAEICRRYCFEIGLCVTLEPVEYIYTGGQEGGVRAGLINYPRFPAEPAVITARAEALALLLMEGLHQHSVSIQTPDKTIWLSRRPTVVSDDSPGTNSKTPSEGK